MTKGHRSSCPANGFRFVRTFTGMCHIHIFSSSHNFLAVVRDRMLDWMHLYSDSLCLLSYSYGLLTLISSLKGVQSLKGD